MSDVAKVSILMERLF